MARAIVILAAWLALYYLGGTGLVTMALVAYVLVAALTERKSR